MADFGLKSVNTVIGHFLTLILIPLTWTRVIRPPLQTEWC